MHAYRKMHPQADKTSNERSESNANGSYSLHQYDTHHNIHHRFRDRGDGGQVLSSRGYHDQRIWIRELPDNIAEHQNLEIQGAPGCIIVSHPERQQRVTSKQNRQSEQAKQQSAIACHPGKKIANRPGVEPA